MSEYLFVEKPFLDHLAALSWQARASTCATSLAARGCFALTTAQRARSHARPAHGAGAGESNGCLRQRMSGSDSDSLI